MRHYEIIIMIHPDHPTEQINAMVDKYKKTVEQSMSKIHRLENWGRKFLAYPIQKLNKAFYICMNVECSQTTLNDLIYGFRFNDAVLRHLIINTKEAVCTPSVFMSDEKSKSLL